MMHMPSFNDECGFDSHGQVIDHEHVYDDATGEPCVCPVYGCWFNAEIIESE